ncbi:MAG: DUF2939 domain-containing protein [Methyloceanibacter sp.]
MRWTIWIPLVLVVLLAAYAIWPVLGFYRIASAVESRDASTLTQLVDFRSLRKSLTKQLLATYLELTGKEKKLGPIGKSIAMGVGGSIVEPIVARLINAETLLDLLTTGKAGEVAGVSPELAPFSTTALRNGWQTWWASEYGLGDFYVYLPPEKSPDERFRAKLSLSEWQWKLSGIGLPQPLRAQLVQEILKQQKNQKE